MVISEEKYQQLQKRMEKLQILDSDLEEKFIKASGKGGQKVNKSSSCVYLKHLPSKIEIKCSKSRSREENRFFARRLLCEKIEEARQEEKSAKQAEIEKIRRQKRKRSKRAKEKMLEEKRTRSSIKALRSKPSQDYD